jgi:peptidyl-tRNA hydrolase, PTH1 family
MKLVVGLGNPGSKYESTRHNVGFEIVDRIAAGGSGATFQRKFDGLLAEASIDYHRVLVLKPQTFMNLSGRSVAQAVRFYKIELADVLVICDDLNLPLAKLRIRGGGSDGGQKGLRDITAQLGSDAYARLRVGIGERGEADAADFVLSRFRSSERVVMEDAMILASQAVAVWTTQGLAATMNRFNGPAEVEKTKDKDKGNGPRPTDEP